MWRGGGQWMRAGRAGPHHVDDDVVLEPDVLDHFLGHPRPHHVDVHHVQVHLRGSGAPFGSGASAPPRRAATPVLCSAALPA